MALISQINAVSAGAGAIVGLAAAAIVAFWIGRRWSQRAFSRLQRQVEEQRDQWRREVQEVGARNQLEWENRKVELEQDVRQQHLDLQNRDQELANAIAQADKERERAEKVRLGLEQRMEALLNREMNLQEQVAIYRKRLQEVGEWSQEQARAALREEVERDCEEVLRDYRATLLQRTEREVQQEARRTLLAVMQRLSTQPNHDVTATIVKLPSEDLKGRIIGREGRNIKAFESVTGTTLLIDETPDSVLISSFDPVRREVARLALEHLLQDGRIHPASIEDATQRAEQEVKESVTQYGEEAVRRLRLSRMHPEVIACIGRLHFRLSNNQNSLDHSIEVANLCGLLAAELGLDPNLARRAGLLHDIGKVLPEDYEGSHAVAGANFLKRFGTEDPRVINAVAAHHEEVPAESAYVPILMISDSISALRPGARAESIDSYIQRVRALEDIARRFDGVAEAYALQAGREIRIIVRPDEVDDKQARLMAREIRRRIEEEMQYPGTIRVTVIRETRSVETAK